MKIAEDYEKNGMTAGTAFKDAITRIVQENQCKLAIETGAYLGLGTTKAILEGQRGFKQSFLYSIEVNQQNCINACINNIGERVCFINGLSIPGAQIPIGKEEDWLLQEHGDIFIDHQPKDRLVRYNKEIIQWVYVQRDCLSLVFQIAKHPDFILLDSAGHLGLIEFHHLMTLVTQPFILALDDTNHIKHHFTVKEIEKDSRFKEIFSTDEKFGSKIYQFIHMDF